MSRISNKLLLGLAGGAAVLAMVGVGAGASFSSSASGSGSVQMGTVTMFMNAMENCNPNQPNSGNGPVSSPCGTNQQATYTSDGSQFAWGLSGTANGENQSFTMTPLTGIGSSFSANIPVQAYEFTGSLPLTSASLTVTDASTSSGTLDSETTVSIATPGGTPIWSGSLQSLINAGKIALPSSVLNILNSAVNSGDQLALPDFIVSMSSPSGGYTNDNQGMTMDPTFTITGEA